jgi:hypothetical protein
MQQRCGNLSHYEFTPFFDVIGSVRMVLSPLLHFVPSDRNVDYVGPIDKM